MRITLLYFLDTWINFNPHHHSNNHNLRKSLKQKVKLRADAETAISCNTSACKALPTVTLSHHQDAAAHLFWATSPQHEDEGWLVVQAENTHAHRSAGDSACRN